MQDSRTTVKNAIHPAICYFRNTKGDAHIGPKQATVCVFVLFYVLATYKVISGRVPTCDNVCVRVCMCVYVYEEFIPPYNCLHTLRELTIQVAELRHWQHHYYSLVVW